MKDSSTAADWVKGPEFLWSLEINSEQPNEVLRLEQEDPEVKRQPIVATCITSNSTVDTLIARCSSWPKLKRVTAWVLLAIQKLRNRVIERKTKLDNTMEKLVQCKKKLKVDSTNTLKNMTLPDNLLQLAEATLIRDAPSRYYDEELQSLVSQSKGQLKQSSRIKKLDPFVQDGLLRVGGRLSRCSLPYDAKHQILVPQNSPQAKLILEDVHRRVGHLGRNSMTAELRKMYWIPQAALLIKGIISKCVLCRKYRSDTCSQKMADLPKN
jgi:hypothetical protein